MSQFIKFYFTSSMLKMFRTLIHPSSGACDFSIVSPHWLCVLVLMCVGREGIRGLMGEKGLMEEEWKDRDRRKKKIR